MEAGSQTRIGMAIAIAVTVALAGCNGSSDVAVVAPPPPLNAGETATERLTVENQCGDDVWLVSTPPGNAAAVQSQWDWLLASATKRNSLPNGGTVGAVLVTRGQSRTFAVPDRGAPGGNVRFYMGCPNASAANPGGDPFDRAGCLIGSSIGDLAAINTLFEPTFGCKPGVEGPQCAFNPAADAAQWPNCASNPGPGTCPPMPPSDNFDVSAVDGYTIALKVVAAPAAGKTCNRLETDAGMLDLASCPREDASTLFTTEATQQARIASGISLLTRNDRDAAKPLQACVAPFHWFQSDTLGEPPSPIRASGECNPSNGTFGSQCFYAGAGCDRSRPTDTCPSGSGPQQRVGPKADGTFAIHNTHWVQDLYRLGYKGYTWQYGDGVGDQTCDWGAAIKVTLCPAGGVPYRSNQLWTFSAGTCTTDGTVGTPDGATTFGSLAACQNARMRFVCEDQTASDPFRIPSAMWKADLAATLSGGGYLPAQIAALKQTVCAPLNRDIPGFGTLTLPQCNFVYGTNGTTCPSAVASSVVR